MLSLKLRSHRSQVALCASLMLACCCAAAAPEDVARALAQRVVPSITAEIVLETIPPDGGNDVFELEGQNGRIVLRGSSGVALASALNHYLEEYAGCDVSWNGGGEIVVPRPLPEVPRKVRIVSPHEYRFAYNYCTHGYTMAWWDWPQWERELDFLALKGVNLALVIQGQEQVWIEALAEFGYAGDAVRSWLCAPSHVPWQYMSNLENYGGPLSAAFVAKRLALGQRIVGRMRALGIQPVLQGYYGIVPSDFKDRYPLAKVHTQGDWGGLKRPDMLDPLDPLFPRLAAAFYRAQTRLFGEARFLAADPFHEGGRLEGIDLAASGRAIHGAMLDSDSSAVWVLQSWEENPRQAMIDGLDKASLLVLDLHCEGNENWRQRNQFGGTPWLWCTIQNWGGNVGLWGDLESVRVRPARALAEAGPGAGQMRGIGALMEGSQTQPMIWAMFFQNAWLRDAPDRDAWVRNYVRRRYGTDSPAALQAAHILLETVYSGGGDIESVVCARPSLEPFPKARLWGSTEPHYDTTRLVEAWHLMLESAEACGSADGFRYDLTDVGRQVLADLAGRYHRQILEAYRRKDAPALAQLSRKMLGLLRDLDALLATRKEFLLGAWLADARAFATTREERDRFEVCARELVTIWSNQGGDLVDYANRQWAGLVGTFYYARWQTWLAALQAALESGQPLDVAAIRARIDAADRAWTQQHDEFAAEPLGDGIDLSHQLFARYSEDARVSLP